MPTDNLFQKVPQVTLQIAPEEVGMLLVLSNRGLNTWPDAPKPLWDLNAKCEEFIQKHPEYAFVPGS